MLDALRKKTNALIDKAEEVAGVIQNKADAVATSIKEVVNEHLPEEEMVTIESGKWFTRVIVVEDMTTKPELGAELTMPRMYAIAYIPGPECAAEVSRKRLLEYEKSVEEHIRADSIAAYLEKHTILCLTGYGSSFTIK